MEKELNIAAILKDKPIGTKLWSLVYGECLLNSIDPVYDNIWIKYKGFPYSFNKNGKSYLEGECLLFPSKEMRDWEKFAWKKGDVIINGCGFQCIFKEWASDDYTKFNGCYSNSRDGYEDVLNADTMKFQKIDNNIAYGYIREIEKKLGGKFNLETLTIDKPKPEFKDGDIVFAKCEEENKADYIVICKKIINYRIYDYCSLNIDTNSLDCTGAYCLDLEFYSLHLATDSEKQQLIDALAKENKAWDADKKAIVDLSKKCEFKAFDFVLFKNWASKEWTLGQYSHSRDNLVVLVGGIVLDCNPMIKGGNLTKVLPYNDSTKHLLGTTDEWKGGEG